MGVLTAGFFIVFYPVLLQLVSLWMNSDDNSYGAFVIPISAYIIWLKKETLQKLPVKPSNWGLPWVVLSILMYSIANYADILTLKPFTMVLTLSGMVLYLFGVSIFKELIFPLFFLFFLVPVPTQIYSALTIPLQLLVTRVSVFAASILDISVLREGNIIHLPNKSFQVVQACSGLRSLVSIITLSTVFGYLTLRMNVLRSILCLSAIPVAVFVNILRVFLMVILFHYLHIDLAENDTVHSLYGALIFILALILIVIIKRILSYWDTTATNE